MADFWKAMYYVLDWEGGYSNDPADRGGATNYGITQSTLTRYINTHPGARVPDRVERIGIKDAEEIYKADYWKFDKIESQSIATKLFDISINMGYRTAIKMVQSIIGLDVDGVLGPITAAAINAKDPADLMLDLVNSCVNRYLSILAGDPSQEKFRRGWLRRAKSIPPG